MERARQGSLHAFNQLVLRYQARAYSLAYHLLGDQDEAADALQDGFVKAYQHLSQFRGGAFGAWLLRIVTNNAYDELRSRRRRNARSVSLEYAGGEEAIDGTLPDLGESPEHAILRQEQTHRIRAAISTLPPDLRTVLVLREIEGLQYTEIANIARIPLGTVKSRLARARGYLAAQLQLERSCLPTRSPDPQSRRSGGQYCQSG